jgi:hypothetical protein
MRELKKGMHACMTCMFIDCASICTSSNTHTHTHTHTHIYTDTHPRAPSYPHTPPTPNPNPHTNTHAHPPPQTQHTQTHTHAHTHTHTHTHTQIHTPEGLLRHLVALSSLLALWHPLNLASLLPLPPRVQQEGQRRAAHGCGCAASFV